MNRTDRLVALVMLLQSRRVVTAAEMATHFEITERTVYRDLAALGESGVPVLGEPGVGYSLMRGYQLPPVMFTTQEAFALVTGGLLAEQMTDESVREPMKTALGKITAVLPAEMQGRVQRVQTAMLVRSRKPGAGPVSLSRVQQGVAERRVMKIKYLGAARDEATEREVEPLGLIYYLDHWHLIGWCRLRDEARDFRVDRIQRCDLSTECPPPRRGFHLHDYLSSWYKMPDAEEVEVVFHPRLMDMVRRHWGPSLLEECKQADGIRVRLSVCEWSYLARWLLSFGDKVKIIRPDKLKREIVKAASEALKHHSQP